MIVHDIEMHDIRARIKDGVDVVTQAREIGREYGRSDQWFHRQASS